MKNIKRNVIIGVAAFFAIAAVVFSYVKIYPFANDVANTLLNSIISRVCAGIAAILALFFIGFGSILKIKKHGLLKNLLWCLPCFLVVFANFPYSALIKGSAQILHTDLIPLFILKCLAIAVMEEAIFRGIVHNLVAERMTNREYPTLAAVFISSAIFGAWHLLNLLEGAGVFATFLQVGYGFLTGAMFAAVTVKTGNIWGAVLMHAIFDVGGLIITDIGSGSFQDNVFWILTAVCGVICLLHVVLYLYKKDKNAQSDSQPNQNL